MNIDEMWSEAEFFIYRVLVAGGYLHTAPTTKD